MHGATGCTGYVCKAICVFSTSLTNLLDNIITTELTLIIQTSLGLYTITSKLNLSFGDLSSPDQIFCTFLYKKKKRVGEVVIRGGPTKLGEGCTHGIHTPYVPWISYWASDQNGSHL